ncbi:hypothetical protein TNIN_321931 [Trichonephila inaurata madagascariensis]|uniref:Uncharacterized protein n=1 Tax=Trichonephila inaurata madagascariensis TaxID=2747483 RepID=A0A8X7C620_9ARAC|nr:hypothetical protein TNIN_321931 [Trichonephila inaurata madagascariensis]
MMDQYPGEENPNEPLEPMDRTLESMDKSNKSMNLEQDLMDKCNEPLEQEVIDQFPINTFSEIKSNVEHCDGEGCHEVLYKLLEHYSPESLDELLDHVDKPLLENTKKKKKESTEETMERGNKAMECNESGEEVIKLSDLEHVVMECCEEILDNVEFGEVENAEVEKKVEMAQPEKVTMKKWWNFKWLSKIE